MDGAFWGRLTSINSGGHGVTLQTDRALELALRHQRQIAGRLAETGNLLSLGEASNPKALALHRWELMRALREYQLFKHTEVFDPIIAAACSPRANVAKVLKARCIALAAAYDAHVRRWALDGPTSAWSDYRADALAMVGRIQEQITAEMHEIRALLQDVVRIQRP